MKKYRHTEYCELHLICDKEINCFEGESCPFFEHTHDFSSLDQEPTEDRGAFSMDEIWEHEA